MQPFVRLTGIAAPLPLANIDTDLILSAKFLKTVSRTGLGTGLFHALRADRPDFVLNRDPWRRANILITHGNFGCGSSREHAPWALLDFGIRCVIAPGFADIFHGNCFKNGILPIRLPQAEVDRLIALVADPATATLTIDLEAQTIADQAGVARFDIDSARRQRLLHGIDDIAQSLAFAEPIAAHERSVADEAPWLADTRLSRLR
jgi:3-isopropylmalate/(R)-2-methylmalate dehydratase small subunit